MADDQEVVIEDVSDDHQQVVVQGVAAYGPRMLGRYEIIGNLGHGGMATVYLARTAGEAGFHRLFAIKALHPHLAADRGFVAMLLDEARIAARLHHPNVVPIVDLGSQDGVHYVAMEYVEGCAMSALLYKSRNERSPKLLVPIILDALAGLHAAHTLVDDDGRPLLLVHRDVSPQNVLVGIDGVGRITDFGVARAESRINTTRPGQLKGKLSYLSPEQIKGGTLDHRSDIFSAGAMLWSALTGLRLFRDASSDAATMANILTMEVPPPSTVGFKPPPELDAICLRALERDPDKRFASAQEMEEALREAATKGGFLGSRREVAEWVSASFKEELGARRNAVRSALSQAASRAHPAPDSQPSMSGLRMIPTVGSLSPEETTPPTLAAVQAPPGKSSTMRYGLLALGLVAVIAASFAVAVSVVSRHDAAQRPLQAPVAATEAPHATSTPTAAPSPPPTTTVQAEQPTPVAAPVAPAPPAVTATHPAAIAAGPRFAVHPTPTTKPTASAAPKPDTKPPPTTAPASPHWDKDSPLPPP